MAALSRAFCRFGATFYDDIMCVDFFERVKQEVRLRNLTIEAVAMEAGLSRGSYYTYQRRGLMPRADEAVKIAQALGVSVEYLVTGESTASWRPPSRIASIVDDLLVLDDPGLHSVSVLAKGLAAAALPTRQASSGGG